MLSILLRPSSTSRILALANGMRSCQQASRTLVQWQRALEHLDPKQVQCFHSEKLIKVDDNDLVLGSISKGESHSMETIRKNIYHRALSLLVFNSENKFLLTQRAASKITFPNYYTNACCSHPLYNDHELEDDGDAIGVRRAVVRRSQFELGINLDDMKPEELFFLTKLAYRAASDGGEWGEAEIDYIFVVKKDIKLKPNVDEVQSYRYVTREEMQDLLLNEAKYGVKLTPWFKLLAREILFDCWDNINNLDRVLTPKNIVRYEDDITDN